MQGWESVCWLVIGITLPEHREIGSIYHIFVSCFLIEMKFISKLFIKFRRENESQEIPRLRLFIFSWKIHRIWSKIIKHNSKKWKFKITDNVFKSMGGRNLGLGTYPSQNARLFYYFLHLSLKIGPTVANKYSSWPVVEIRRILEEWGRSLFPKMTEIRDFEV